MKARDLFFRILAVILAADIVVEIVSVLTGIEHGAGKTFADAILLSLISAPLLYLFVVKDVARRLTEQTELSRRMQSLLNNLNGVVYRGHRDWSISLAGAGIEKLTGHAPEEFLQGGLLWTEIIHPDDRGWLKTTFREAARSKRNSIRVEYRIRRRNGEIRWIADRRQMMYDESGAFDYVDGLLLDITERKEVDRRLAESEHRFRSIADTASDGILTADSKGTIGFFNRTAERMFGCTADEIVGKNLTALIPERFHGAHKAAMERLLKTGESRVVGRTVTLEALKGDGTEFPIDLSLGMWGPRDAPLFSAIVRDVAERKEWERSLKESEEKFRSIFEDSKDGYILVDVSSRKFHTGNRVFCDMLQYSLDEIRRLGLTDIHPEEDVPWILEEFDRRARHETEKEIDVPVRRKDGSIFLAEVKSSPMTISGKEYVLGNFRDITESRKKEEALTRLDMAVEHAADAVVITDTDGRIQYVNPAFERITGYPREDAVGHNMRILNSGEHDEAFYRSMWETISRGNVWKGRFVNRRKDGTLYDEEAVISPVRNDSGRIVSFVAGKRDITREVELQKQVRIAQRMESVGTLAGGIAHEFNNALTGIVGFAELLSDRMAGDEPGLRDLAEIQRCAERASTLTRQLLTFACRQVVEPVNLDLNVLVAEFIRLIGRVVGERIEIMTSMGKDVPAIRADRGQIEQVVMNLCLNARDAMPEGGRLVVETEDVHIDEVSVRQNPNIKAGRYALLSVSDTGVGMDEKTRERIFEPFFTTKGPDKGTGLGLAVVYGIIEQYGGFIHLHSEPKRGTAFKVYFPAAEDQQDAAPAESREEDVRGGIETVLLADDEEAVRSFIGQALKELGYDVLVARNGEEAIELSRRNSKIGLAILDVAMPRMGGVEAFEEMRKENPKLKGIFISGYSADEIHDSLGLTPGMPFLQKPFGSSMLAGRLREVLDEG